MKRKPTVITSFENFLEQFHEFLYCYNSIQPDYCLELSHQYYYDFRDGYSEQELNNDIRSHQDMFQWEEIKQFYYPNTNMHSYSNARTGIKGYIVRRIEE